MPVSAFVRAASAILIVPRAAESASVFRAPLHPLPIIVFLMLVAAIVVLFAVARPMQTLTSALVISLGIPVAWALTKRRSLDVAAKAT